MQKWEYMTKRMRRSAGILSTNLGDFEAEWTLDELGEAGWELVEVVPVSSRATAYNAGNTTELWYIFKRPKQQA